MAVTRIIEFKQNSQEARKNMTWSVLLVFPLFNGQFILQLYSRLFITLLPQQSLAIKNMSWSDFFFTDSITVERSKLLMGSCII